MPSLFSRRRKKNDADAESSDEIRQKMGESLKHAIPKIPPERSPVANEREEKCLLKIFSSAAKQRPEKEEVSMKAMAAYDIDPPIKMVSAMQIPMNPASMRKHPGRDRSRIEGFEGESFKIIPIPNEAKPGTMPSRQGSDGLECTERICESGPEYDRSPSEAENMKHMGQKARVKKRVE